MITQQQWDNLTKEQQTNLWAQWAQHIHEDIKKNTEYLKQWEDPTYKPKDSHKTPK